MESKPSRPVIVPIHKIRFHRAEAPSRRLESLALAMKASPELIPVRLRMRPDGTYDLVGGGRSRLNAALLLNWTEYPALIQE